MTEKSYVSIERRLCVVCGAEYDTNALLIDKHLQPSLEKYTVTGWGLCSKDRELYDAGFVALVEIDPLRSGDPPDGARVGPEQVYRTGTLAHLRWDAVARALSIPVQQIKPCIFVEPGLIQKLQEALSASTSTN